MPEARTNGIAALSVAAGILLVYSGLTNRGILKILQAVIQGKSPASVTGGGGGTINTQTVEDAAGMSGLDAGGTIGPATGGTGGSETTSAGAAANQALARLMVAIDHPDWAAGQQWSDWVSLWNQESGWSNTSWNQSSGAFGLAQALGHATPGSSGTVPVDGTLHNEYGANYGLDTSGAIAANNGSASDQITWGINYIAQRYGSPSAAWAHEVSAGWY